MRSGATWGSFCDWLRAEHRLCPNNPWNTASLGHRWPVSRLGYLTNWQCPGECITRIYQIPMLDATLTDRVAALLSASQRSDVPPFMVMDVMAAAERIEAEGGHVIHMEVGQPAAPAPRAALAAAHRALEEGRIGYTSALGTPSLRERIARHYRDTYGCAVDAERIVVTTGSSS